ncbi:MAG: ATP-binding protein [Vicinamibacterales bacterium]
MTPSRRHDTRRPAPRAALDAVAERLVRPRTADAQELTEGTRARLRAIAHRLAHGRDVSDRRGRSAGRPASTTILLAGARGTGQTLAATELAHELGRPLYRIDLSQVVSEYIGETEKNLDRVFDAAAQADAILLFDEGEALFGKRSEVKDSHDRYAGADTEYLLQRMAAYPGVAILATNVPGCPNATFARRFDSVVECGEGAE